MSGPRDWTDAGPQDVPDRDPNEGDPAEEWDEEDETTGLRVGELFDSLFCRGLGGTTAPAH